MNNSAKTNLAILEQPPFCQIVNHEIPVLQCREMQGQPKCFGCGSTSRMCESCGNHLVDVPAVGLCSLCLTMALKDEREAVLSAQPEEVKCQMMRRDIARAMCLASQGQTECRNCPAPSRICEKCQDRPSKFPQYGLCLKCSVEEFGEGWKPDNVLYIISDQGDTDATPNSNWRIELPYMRKRLTVPRPPAREGVKRGPKQNRQTPWDSIPPPTPQQSPVVPAPEPPAQIAKYMPQVRKLVKSHKQVSARFFQTELRVDFYTAKPILEQCEKEGLIGPADGTRPRQVLIHVKEKVIPVTPNLGLCKCGRGPIKLKKLGLCKTCAGRLYKQVDRQKRAYNEVAKSFTETTRQLFEGLPPDPAAVLVSIFAHKAKLFSYPKKIAKLQDLIKTFGEGETADILTSILLDLQGWEVINVLLKRYQDCFAE